jgi:hypothetical protein
MTKFDSAEIPISDRKPFAEEAPIMICQDDARQGSMGHQVLMFLDSGLPAQSSQTLPSSFISLGYTHQAENWSHHLAACGGGASAIRSPN